MSSARTSPPDADREPRASKGGVPARRGIKESIRSVFDPYQAAPGGKRLARAWRKTLHLLWPLGAVSHGNEVRVIVDGDQTFEAMWADIARAERSVHLTTYIFEHDRVGQRTLEELVAAAKRGCRVLVVLDAFGSHRLDRTHLEPLRAAGGEVLFYNPLVAWPIRVSRLVRNHRKILVIDRCVSFCGGMNVAEEYAGSRHGTGLFRDTQLRIAGPAAHDLATVVEELARIIDGEKRQLPGQRAEPNGDGCVVQILESPGRRRRASIQKALHTKLGRAIERCYLTSPYFVPPRALMVALCEAARRGVDVRVLTAGRSDVPAVRLASQHLYGRLLRAGVRIFEFGPGVLHAKTGTVDGVSASVGSFNLDYWSYRRNLEVSVGVFGGAATRELELQFDADLAGAAEVHLASWEGRSRLQRLLHWAAYQLMRL